MLCCHRDGLAITYLLSLDDLDNSKHESPKDQPELAAIRRLRLEAHRLYAFKDLLSHCRAHGCATPEVEDLLLGVSKCDRDELVVDYLLSLDELEDARQEASRAFTVTQVECAATRRSRIEAHRLSALDALLAHCGEHGCLTPELAELAGVGRQPSVKPFPGGVRSTYVQATYRAPDAGATGRIR
jgi:hypothetical protein